MSLDTREFVISTFRESQGASAPVKVLTIRLKQLFQTVIRTPEASVFCRAFVGCLDHLLTRSKKDQCAERVFQFVVEFMTAICPQEVDENSENNSQEDEAALVFVEEVIQRYLPGFEAEDSAVRLRCMTIATKLVSLGAFTTILLDRVQVMALERLADSDTSVRLQAIVLVSTFDLDPENVNGLLSSSAHDPTPDLRLTATYNVAKASRETANRVAERVRDYSVPVKLAMFNKVLPHIDFRTLTIERRETVARAGLTDRDDGVRQAAAAYIAHRWLAQCGNNIGMVLQRLDVIQNTEIVDKVVAAILEQRRGVAEQIEFGPEFFDNLTAEDCVLLRGFQEFCNRLRLFQLKDRVMPELTDLANEIETVWVQLDKYYDSENRDEETEEAIQMHSFKVEQLLLVSSRYDFDDEASRQRIAEVSYKIMTADNGPTERMIDRIADIQRKLNSTDAALISWAFETLEATPSMATQQQAESNTALLAGILRALMLCTAVLSRVNSPEDIEPFLPNLYTTYIYPALVSPMSDFRYPALKCLSAACIMNSKFTKQYYKTYIEFITNNGMRTNGDDILAQEVAVCIQALTDMILNHVDPIRGIADAAEDTCSGDSSGMENLSMVGGDTSIGDNSGSTSMVQSKKKQGIKLPTDATVKKFVSMLESSSLTVQSAAAFSIAKLVLAKVLLWPEDVLHPLVLYYYESTEQVNEPEEDANFGGMTALEQRAKIQQYLTLFLKAYTLYDDGKYEVARVFLNVATEFREWLVDHESPVTLGDLVKQIVDLTNQRSPAPTANASTSRAHCLIGANIVDLMFSSKSAMQRNALCQGLKLLVVEYASDEELLELKDSLEGYDYDILNTAVRKIMDSFIEKVQSLVPLERFGNLIEPAPVNAIEPAAESSMIKNSA